MFWAWQVSIVFWLSLLSNVSNAICTNGCNFRWRDVVCVIVKRRCRQIWPGAGTPSGNHSFLGGVVPCNYQQDDTRPCSKNDNASDDQRCELCCQCWFVMWNYFPKLQCFFSSRMRVMNHNWSATKQRLHPQSVAEISRHSVLSGDRIRQCETSSGSRHKDTDQCL